MYKLVLVDDEAFVLNNISCAFDWKTMGFEVVGTFTNANDTLEYLKKDKADVVITDINMPNKNGTKLAEEIRKNYPDTVVVFMSGHKLFDYAMQGINVGVFAYMVKPVSFTEIEKLCVRLKNELDTLRLGDNTETALHHVISGFSNVDDDDIIEKIVSYIDKYYMNKLSLLEVASSVYMSKYHFCRYFKSRIGMNFIDYLNKIRIEQAIRLLHEPNQKINEICSMVGYSNYKYFFKLFKAQTGMTPREYRMRNYGG